MSGQHAPKPSPLAGEGAERRRREAGEGAFAVRHLIEGTNPYPAGGEGTEQAARAEQKP